MKKPKNEMTARPGAYGMTRATMVSYVIIAIGATVLVAALAALAFGSTTSALANQSFGTAISESAAADTFGQRVLQDILKISISRHGGNVAFDVHADLNDAATQLETKLTHLASLPLAPATIATLATLHDNWAPIRKSLALLGDYPSTRDALDAVVARTLDQSPKLIGGLADVRRDLETDATAKASAANSAGWIAFFVAIIGCAIAGFGVFARLRESGRESKRFGAMLERMVGDLAKSTLRLTDSQAASEIMLETVGQGMLMLDERGIVKRPYSNELVNIFNTENIAGRTISDLLRPLVVERTIRECEPFLAALFGSDVSDEAVENTNVLDEVELAKRRADGTIESRFISFAFRRVREGNDIEEVFVSVTDVTDRIRLKRELVRSERSLERQNSLIKLAMHTTSGDLATFMARAESGLRTMNEALRAEDFALASRGRVDLLHERLESLVESIISVRLAAESIHFDFIAKLAASFERRVAKVRALPTLDGDAFLSVVVMNVELRAELDEIGRFRDQLASVQRSKVTIAAGPAISEDRSRAAFLRDEVVK
jgi:hypothetical protein